MCHKITEKFHSHRGVSMLLALVLLLVCATVGAVALTAASVSMGRYRANRNAQQEYLAVMSAAELIKKDFEDLTFQGVYVRVVTTETEEDDEGKKTTTRTVAYRSSNEDQDNPYYTHLTGSKLLGASELELSGLFNKDAEEEIKKKIKAGEGYNFDIGTLEQECTFIFPGASSDSDTDTTTTETDKNTEYGIPAVYGRVTVGDNYLLTVELSTDEALIDESDGSAEAMLTMVFQPTQTWPPAQCGKKSDSGDGEAESSEDEKENGSGSSSRTTDYYYFGSKVTWSSPVISKGAVMNETEDDEAEPAAVNDFAPDSYNKDTDAY